MLQAIIDSIRHDGIDFGVDPFEPPMPPKITRDQAVKFAQSLVRGEPNRERIALTVLGDKVRELL